MPRPDRPKKPPIGENPIETNEFLFWQNSETPKEINDNSFLLSCSFFSPLLNRSGEKEKVNEDSSLLVSIGGFSFSIGGFLGLLGLGILYFISYRGVS